MYAISWTYFSLGSGYMLAMCCVLWLSDTVYILMCDDSGGSGDGSCLIQCFGRMLR